MVNSYDGITHACGYGLPEGAPCNTYGMCAGCACSCHEHRMGWWTLSGEDFLEAMKRAHVGEDPDMLYAEYFANATIESH